MKKLLLILSAVFLSSLAHAQEPGPDLSDKKQQDIEALKVAFISRELDLTPEEAQKFWPVYNQYSTELSTVVKGNNEDVLERDEKVLNLRKRYRDQFTKILGPQRMNRMYGAEGRFRKLLVKALQRQQTKRALKNNRPLRNQ
jgi:hypothetical protein